MRERVGLGSGVGHLAVAKQTKIELAQFGDLMKSLHLAESALSASIEFARNVQADAHAQVEDHRKIMREHLSRKDLRPHVNFKPLPKNNWAVTFNSSLYTLGPHPRFADMDEDDAAFLWTGPDNVQHPVRSMFQALVAVVSDYCNADQSKDGGSLHEEAPLSGERE